MFLPDIYWCNGSKVEQFLGMIVENYMAEYTIKESQGTAKNIDFGTDAGKVIAKYQKQGEITTQREGTVTKSVSTMFKDLYTLLEAEDKIQKLYGLDKEI